MNKVSGKYNKQLLLAIMIAVISYLLYCAAQHPWNSPYAASEALDNTLYGAFAEQPKHLDPARSYSSDEYRFIAQIYEPPLQYHYLKRPYTLIPLTATKVPEPHYLDEHKKPLPLDAPAGQIAYTDYFIDIQPGIYYQNHPAFVREQGQYLYHNLTAAQRGKVYTPYDFAKLATRELVASDYVYQIKRLANPRLNSPILGLMSTQIVGLSDLAANLEQASSNQQWLDLRQYPLEGVKEIASHRYRIRIHGKNPQFLYWLAMPFFAPMPWEAERFYEQEGFAAKNMVLNWFPVGSGPYQLQENNPNRQMVMVKNPNFHGETYPSTGMPDDEAQGLLANAGKPLPFIDKAVFNLDKESIPRWSKFLQGYYDSSGIASDNFDQAISLGGGNDATLSPALAKQQIRLQTSVSATTYYWGFNWLDPIVGGNSDRARKLRQAISIALDMEEYIAIFANGRGVSANGPLPPGLFGYRKGQEGMNPQVYSWQQGEKKRLPLQYAKELLAAAGYPNGVDRVTGKPLVLHYDVVARGGPDDKARLSWMVKQFKKLDITLIVRSTQYSRFQEKMSNGQAQIFSWGWHADYPDPENFLFLLYGANAKAKTGGENAANYHNPEFDALYLKMKEMEDGPKRQQVIDEMVKLLRVDVPWIWGLHPTDYALSHTWNHIGKPNQMANNTLKYQRLDPELRHQLRQQWNKPILWPLLVIFIVILITGLPVYLTYSRKMLRPNQDRLP